MKGIITNLSYGNTSLPIGTPPPPFDYRKSPAEMLFGRKLRTKLPQIRDVIDDLETRDRDSEQKHRMVERRNTKLRPHSLRVGDMVLVKRDNPGKSDTIFYPTPFTIREVQGPMVVVETEQGRRFRRNVTFLKPYILPDTSYVAGKGGSDMPREASPIQNREPTSPIENTTPDTADTHTDTDDPKKEVATHNHTILDEEIAGRPKRKRQLPSHLKDHITYYE